MKLFKNTPRFAICLLLSVLISAKYSYAEDKEILTEMSSEIKELIEESSRPVNMTGELAKAISVALNDYSKFESPTNKIEDYLINAYETKDCFFVQFISISNQVFAGYPPRYCINKKTYEYKQITEMLLPLGYESMLDTEK